MERGTRKQNSCRGLAERLDSAYLPRAGSSAGPESTAMSEDAAPVTQEEVLAFVRAGIESVWELELLLLLQRSPERRWSALELERELRASATVIASALRRLRAAEVVAEPERDRFQYLASSPRTDHIVQALERAYRTNPVSVIKTILGAPDARLKVFSDAFRFKD